MIDFIIGDVELSVVAGPQGLMGVDKLRGYLEWGVLVAR